MGASEDDDIKEYDFGLHFGGGINFGSLCLIFQYGIGLTNLSPVTQFVTAKDGHWHWLL